MIRSILVFTPDVLGTGTDLNVAILEQKNFKESHGHETSELIKAFSSIACDLNWNNDVFKLHCMYGLACQ